MNDWSISYILVYEKWKNRRIHKRDNLGLAVR